VLSLASYILQLAHGLPCLITSWQVAALSMLLTGVSHFYTQCCIYGSLRHLPHSLCLPLSGFSGNGCVMCSDGHMDVIPRPEQYSSAP